MERRDIALSVAIGLLFAGAVTASTDFATLPPIAAVVDVASRFWYAGVAAVLVAAFVRRGLSQSAARVIGFGGMVWVAFVAGVPLLSFLGSAIAGSPGP